MKLKVKDRQSQPKKVKQRRIYLAEPHDYFGVKYVLKMQERQRQLAKEGLSLGGMGFMMDYSTSPREECKPVNGIVPSKCWRAYDLHNKPRGLYSEEEKRLAALEASYYRRTAISIPLKEVLTNKVKSYVSRWTGKKMESEPLMATNLNSSNCPGTPSKDTDNNSNSSSISVNSIPSLNYNCSSSKSSDGSIRLTKHVHFAPQTVFCERDTKSPFWRRLTAKRRVKAVPKPEKDDMHRPRPFLPYLESGLSYCDDEEFYRLKNSNAHRNPQVILAQRNNRRREEQGRCWQVVTRALRFCFCCLLPRGQESRRQHNYDWSTTSGNYKSRSHSYRTRKDFHEKYL